MTSKFIIDFEGEEDYVERAPLHAVTAGGYRRRYANVAFTLPEMVEFMGTGYVGKMRPKVYLYGGPEPDSVTVKRGRNDRLIRFYNHDRHRMTVDYRLFENRIATVDIPDANGPVYLELRDAGWKTKTTKDRIDTLLDSAGIEYRIVSHRGVWYVAPNDPDDPDRTWNRNEWLPWGDGKTFAVEPR